MKRISIMMFALFLTAVTTVTTGHAEDVSNEPESGSGPQGAVGYNIRKYVVSSGGGKISGGDYELLSVIGQVDAGHNSSNNGFSLSGGFLRQNNDLIFKNGFE